MYDLWTLPEKDKDFWVPVRLVHSVDLVTGQTGKVVGDLTVTYLYEGTTGAGTAYAPAAANWKEGDNGDYWLQIGASEFANYGRYRLTVACAGCHTYTAILNVGIDMTNVDWDNPTNFYSQQRRIHALVNGVKLKNDHPNTPDATIFRNEADDADAITLTHSTDGANIEYVTPTT